jgi:hypothetical protein
MSRLPLAFFTAAVIYGLAGMAWGAYMGATENFTLAPAHAHLNLLGWVTLSLMGGFYALAGPRAPVRLGWINFLISNVGLLILIPALMKLLLGQASATPIVMAGTMITILGMLTFAAAVLSLWATPKAA